MKKDKKKIILLFIILFIILIFLVSIILYLKRQSEIKRIREDEEIFAEQIQSYTSDKTCPRGMATLYSNYKGNRNLNDLYRNLNIFVEYLPKLSENINGIREEEFSNLYQDNESEISKILGLNKDEFINFANYLKKYNLNNKKFNYCEIDSSTYEDLEEYLSFNISFYYQDIEEPINFKIYFSNSKSSNNEVVYNVIN